MPGHLARRANRAAIAAFLVAALAVGWILGARSVQVDQGDIVLSRRQAYDRQQCLVDYLSLPPGTRIDVAGGDARLTELCSAVQELVRPDDPPPDVGVPPSKENS